MATKSKNVVSIKQDDIPAQLENLKQDVATLASTVKSHVEDAAKTKAANLKETTAETKETIKSQFSQVSADVENRIREKPLTSIATAVGAGMLLSLILRR